MLCYYGMYIIGEARFGLIGTKSPGAVGAYNTGCLLGGSGMGELRGRGMPACLPHLLGLECVMGSVYDRSRETIGNDLTSRI